MQKKRTLQFTDNEVLAFAAVFGELLSTGHIEHQDEDGQMFEQAAEVFGRFAQLANIICKHPVDDKNVVRDQIVDALEDRYYSHPTQLEKARSLFGAGVADDGGNS